jgi:hypothetical protein
MVIAYGEIRVIARSASKRNNIVKQKSAHNVIAADIPRGARPNYLILLGFDNRCHVYPILKST